MTPIELFEYGLAVIGDAAALGLLALGCILVRAFLVGIARRGSGPQ
ncbi:MAG: hypothetical protein KGL39_44800 [Patescibacteria group bacterium]|nr:hypothetical protein [Patescibacteria group bacterium]